MKIIVADAGPLIGLARVGQLDLLKQLYDSIMIPIRVSEELKLSSHKPGAHVVSEAIQSGWIQCIAVQNRTPLTGSPFLIDAGEMEAIQLALEQNADVLIIDDKRGRKAAMQQGLHVAGIGGVLIAAKRSGFIECISLILEELTRVGYRLSPELKKTSSEIGK